MLAENEESNSPCGRASEAVTSKRRSVGAGGKWYWLKFRVTQEDIIQEIKRHAFYLKPGQKKRVKEALALKRNRKKRARASEPNQSSTKYFISPLKTS